MQRIDSLVECASPGLGGRWSEPHSQHRVMSLTETHYSLLVSGST